MAVAVRARKFRKKPVVIEAMQWNVTGQRRLELAEWTKGKFRRNPDDVGKDEVFDATQDCWVNVNANDWIIHGVHGEFYPCNPTIFELTYESVV